MLAGLHPATGGSGEDACSGDMLLESLAACAGVHSRDQSPAYDGVEQLLTELEGGAQGLLFASGMAAATTAQRVAEFMDSHPAVTAVLYPGPPESPGHAVARRQMAGSVGAMLSVRLAGGEVRAA